MMKSCEICEYFFYLKDSSDPDRGECREQSPQILFSGKRLLADGTKNIQWHAGFPNIGKKQWCGKFAKKAQSTVVN